MSKPSTSHVSEVQTRLKTSIKQYTAGDKFI